MFIDKVKIYVKAGNGGNDRRIYTAQYRHYGMSYFVAGIAFVGIGAVCYVL